MQRLLSILILIGIIGSTVPQEWFHGLIHDHSEEMEACSHEHDHHHIHVPLDEEAIAKICAGCDHHYMHDACHAHHHQHIHKDFEKCDFIKIFGKQHRMLFVQKLERITFIEIHATFSRFEALQKVLGNSNSLTNKGPPALV